MVAQLFDFFQKPVAVSWPGKRVAVIEISTSTSRDKCPAVLLSSAPATANTYDINATAQVVDPSGSIDNPMTPLMRNTVHEWSHGATAVPKSSEGGAGARNVFFINLDYVRSQMPKGQNDFRFTLRTPGNTAGTQVSGLLTAVKWFMTWSSRGGPSCSGPVSGPFSRFGFLPGNGFAPLVYALPHASSDADVLAATLADANTEQGTQQAAVEAEDPCAFGFNFTTSVDFTVPTTFTIDDILFFDIRVSTYQLTAGLKGLGIAPYNAGDELNFPVSGGSAGWDVSATAVGIGEIKLFGDSGGLSTLQPAKLTFTVRFPDLEVGARTN